MMYVFVYLGVLEVRSTGHAIFIAILSYLVYIWCV